MAIEIVYTVSDNAGKEATTSIKVAGEPTLAGLTGFGAGFATALNNLIAGVIRNAVAYILPSTSTLTSNLISSFSDVKHIAKFSFLTLGGTRVKVNIPAIAEVAIGAYSSLSLNQAQADVAAFITAMEDGINIGGTIIQPCDIGESSITDTIFANEGAKNSGARR